MIIKIDFVWRLGSPARICIDDEVTMSSSLTSGETVTSNTKVGVDDSTRSKVHAGGPWNLDGWDQ